MVVTDEMLQAAVKEAVALGIIPKLSDQETYLKNWEGIKKVVQAALDASAN